MISTDRTTLPASVIEDARAHPEKYRPEVVAGDQVLVVNGTLGSDGLIGIVMAKSVQVTGDPVIGISGGGTTHTVFAWLRVGGVERGPRPEVGGRVLVLDVHLPDAEVLVGQVGRVDFVGYDAIDRLGPLVVFTEPDGTEHRTRVTEWAILPSGDDDVELTPAEEREARKPLQPGRVLVTDPDDLKRLRELRRNVDADLDHWRQHGTKRPRERTVGSLNAADVVPLTLVPVEVFAAGLCGQHCEHCETHEGYGLSDAVSSWSDCNRAAGRIYRVEDMDGLHRDPGDTVQVWVRAEDRAWFEKRFGDDEGLSEDAAVRAAKHSHYVSTYCIHDNHEACRDTCKTCAGQCRCGCHEGGTT